MTFVKENSNLFLKLSQISPKWYKNGFLWWFLAKIRTLKISEIVGLGSRNCWFRFPKLLVWFPKLLVLFQDLLDYGTSYFMIFRKISSPYFPKCLAMSLHISIAIIAGFPNYFGYIFSFLWLARIKMLNLNSDHGTSNSKILN